MPFQTLNQLKTQLGVAGSTDDTLLEQLQASADDFIQTHCQRVFTGGIFTEFHRSGVRYIFLNHFPVDSVSSVQVDPERNFGPETTLDPSLYVVLPNAGMLEALQESFLRQMHSEAIKVVYTATPTIPPAVSRAEAELVSHWYRQIKTHADMNQLNVTTRTDGTIVTEHPWGQSGGFRIPPGVLQLLKPHRLPAMG